MAYLTANQDANYYEGNDGIQSSDSEFLGNYQFTSLNDIITNFMVVYVGENKIIPKAKRLDVAFHAQRAMQELSFDTFKSVKAFEYIVPATLKMPLPQDYVNYVKLSWVDSAGVKRIIYPTSKTSNAQSYQQNSDGSFVFENDTFSDGTDNYFEYGINAVSGVSYPVDGNGEQIKRTILPNFEKETRIKIANTSGSTTDREIGYGPVASFVNSTKELIINFYNSGHDIEVGMAIFGPGIPANSTVTAVTTSTSSNFPGMGVKYTNPAHEAWLKTSQVDPVTGVAIDSPGLPTISLPNGSTLIAKGDPEVIFVNLNKKSTISSSYKSSTPSENNNDDYEDDTYWPAYGERYGLDPQHAQANGSYYIDQITGMIHFSSNISGKTIVLDYISDSLGTNSEQQVHKFAEEAMYKWISHAILAGMANIPEYQVNRFKKERFAAIRTAKLRLSNIKLEEITQVLRGKSKQIKH
tara:strand:+ start:780 stop:2180 length:1401 start_codon:yes stop_codon:yes gene_type:complete